MSRENEKMAALQNFAVFCFICLAFTAAVAVPAAKQLIQPTIVGGENANIENFKYMVSVQKYGMHHCGAAILNEKWLLCAAHCFYQQDQDEYIVRTGTAVFFDGGKTYPVEKIIMHENYNPKSQDSDIALIKVKENIVFDEKTFPVPIPSSKFELKDGEIAVVSGWGYTQEGGPIAYELQQVSVSIINKEKCAENYKKSNITNTMICAGFAEGQKDACQGDSGGPLVLRGTLIGVVSWGRGCARPNSPGVYANVQYFRDWINEKIQVKPVKKSIQITDFNASLLLNYLVS